MVGAVVLSAHRLCLALDTCSPIFIQLFGFNESNCDVSIKRSVVGQIDLLLSVFTYELLDLITAISKGGGDGGQMLAVARRRVAWQLQMAKSARESGAVRIDDKTGHQK